MIDPLVERVVSLNDAAKSCPTRRRSKKPHVSCMYRWTTTGCKGVILESIQIGGTRFTSQEALARFFQRLTLEARPSAIVAPRPLSGEEHATLQQELDSRGL